MSTEFIAIKREALQQLLSNFYEVCSLADEMNIYENPEGDQEMQEMKQWTENKFGRKIEKEVYE